MLGILVMNIQGFAMVSEAYFNPSIHLDLSGLNGWVWTLSHVFADMKFMAIFSMLFGAGIVLATQRRDEAGQSAWRFFYWRNFWLLIFGVIHAFFIWAGDILVTYAIAGFVVFWFRRLNSGWLLGFGILFLAVAPIVSLLGGAAPPEIRAELIASFTPSLAEIAAEIAAYRGSWLDAFAATSSSSLETLLGGIPFYLFWRAGGLMLVGMGLFKLGILSAERSPQFYSRMFLICATLGLPLVIWSAVLLNEAQWEAGFSQFGLGLLPNYVGSVAVALAYVALIMRLVQSGLWAGLQARLAAVGRMAFTNYIMHSVLCTLLFYGFGFGLFGHVERWGQILIVLAIWLLQLWLSPLWLARFRFGLLEWLWRSLTYLKLQPFRNNHGV